MDNRLLQEFLRAPNKVMPYADLHKRVLGTGYPASYLKDRVRSLRLKLESDPSHPESIVNILGMGYVLVDPDRVIKEREIDPARDAPPEQVYQHPGFTFFPEIRNSSNTNREPIT